MKFWNWLDRLINEHALVRRVILFWSVILTSFVTYQVFWVLIPAGETPSAAYATTVGLVTTAIGLYTWGKK